MSKRVAIIDLGTNTFNLLVAEIISSQSYTILHEKKLPVRLGEGGINQGIITEEAQKRALKALSSHLGVAEKLEASHVQAFGTSAIRSAKNKNDFLEKVSSELNLHVEVIDGDREAELIYKGISLSVPMGHTPVLILDIGGGSNEFILATSEKIFWQRSYPLGMARILQKFTFSDPFAAEETEELKSYFSRELDGLAEAMALHPVQTLIGASGSFETFTAMLRSIKPTIYTSNSSTYSAIALEDYHTLHKKLLASTLQERLKMEGLEPMRADMIVPASIFVTFILDKFSIPGIIQSDFSLKEGVLHELIKKYA